MQITVADATAQTALTTPLGVGLNGHLSTHVVVHVVHVHLQGTSFVGLDQSEQIFALVQQRIRTYDVVGEGTEAS